MIDSEMNTEKTVDSNSRQNRLANETSPYLLQHASNPVDWYPWGPEAFNLARSVDKPIFLSVGYSACHWCHVMEHESFENDDIARLLNEHFVSIKVDREERPDVDQIYMTAVQLITKRGGWPMSVFMTHDGKPFYGGTYWPPTSRMGMPGFRDILMKLADYWTNKREEVLTSADQLVNAIQEMAAPVFDSVELSEETLRQATESLIRVADRKHGGLGGAPKFPHPMDLRVLLRGAKRFGNAEALDVATLTLIKMLHGGIYDQLGGGFHRYSTDGQWLVPHFEKMLYDNALLVPAYLEAWQATGHDEFRRAVEETLDYVLREMTDPQGGFYSTQDADSEGVEGKFFVWNQTEIENILGQNDAQIFSAAYDVSKNGNWEGHNILNRPRPFSDVASHCEINETALTEKLDECRQKLFEVRQRRIAPGRDEKILVSWNGMMIAAMSKASFALGNDIYLSAAEKAAAFVIETLKDERGHLVHCFKDGRARFRAYLDDYACLIEGLLELYQASGKVTYIEEAVRLSEEMINDYWDEENGGFFYTANDHESLITRTKDIQDNAVPSGNGMAATVLAKLGRLTGQQHFLDRATRVIDAFSSLLVEHPRACGQAILALDYLLGPTQEVVVAGPPSAANELSHPVKESFLPNSLILQLATSSAAAVKVVPLLEGKQVAGESAKVYLCANGHCDLPAESVEQLERQLLSLEFNLSRN